MANNRHRLRKYQRKKDAARGDRYRWDRLAALYWRYWRKVHGRHVGLWEMNDD